VDVNQLRKSLGMDKGGGGFLDILRQGGKPGWGKKEGG